MTRPFLLLALTLGLIGTFAVAHEGVKNPAVMARMELMKSIGQNTAVLGDMAKGKRAFDAEAAQAAALAIAEAAQRTPAAFRAAEQDPKSEALPAIWEEFATFEQQSNNMVEAARQASVNITTAKDLGPALREIGASCAACHERFRQ